MKRSSAITLAALVASFVCAAPAPASDPLRAHQWNLDMVEADAAHQTTTGAGAVVAVVDTGVSANHPDLTGNVLPGHDFVNNQDGVAPDGNGHGTHVAGIIAALTGNGIGVESVAPGAKILPVKVLGDDGTGDSATVAQGIDWAAAHGADVINLSLGGGGLLSPFSRTEMDDAIDRAVSHGVIVVGAAGNDTFLPFCGQASAARILCVGAVDKRGSRAYYSNFGGGVSLVAPGGSALSGTDEDVLSTWNDGGYHMLAGTSQATPHVSAVAALLVSEGIRGQAAMKRILETATHLNGSSSDLQYGSGIVDAARAVAGLPRIVGTAPGPVPATVPGPSPSGGGGTPPAAPPATSASSSRVQRLTSVLRRGIAVRCTAMQSGDCSVVATASGRRFAAGSARVGGPAPVTVHARLTRFGRALAKRSRRLQVTLSVTLPGASPTQLGVLLRR
ncbi:MAG TPA: S8 family serine peptidase [Solirubrobacteraceae bacterium]|nr:S8 family serine peptidase [Solirubrobacteraceae bacterium]